MRVEVRDGVNAGRLLGWVETVSPPRQGSTRTLFATVSPAKAIELANASLLTITLETREVRMDDGQSWLAFSFKGDPALLLKLAEFTAVCE